MTRSKQVLYWATPALLCVVVYWHGLRAWFQMDDFAWLALPMKVHDWTSFLDAMFRPYAQGTIRPWSERLYFLGGFWLFGMDATPFRLVVFLTQFLNLILISSIVRRVTGSAAAGLLAPILWLVNSNIYQPLSWTSAYNQIQCSFFLLLAFLLFLRYTETGDRRYYWMQWLVFLLGFGALELNVVYPAIAALYALCRARKYFRPTLPLFGVSALYTIVHRTVAQNNTTEIYRMVWDASIFQTLTMYLQWVVGADRLAVELGRSAMPFVLMEVAVGTGLAAFAGWQLARRNWLALFFIGWFFLTLAPYLPLRNHVTDYYLTIPSIGVAMLGGWAIAEAWQAGTRLRWAAVVVALLYAVPSVWAARYYTQHNYKMSQRVRNFLQRVAYAHEKHPGKILLIHGVDSDLFWTAWYDRPFQIFGLQEIYMTADTEPQIEKWPQKSIAQHFLADKIALGLLQEDKALVYEVTGPRLRNVTGIYRRILERNERPDLPSIIRLGSPLYAPQLGEGWHEIDTGFRWMSKRGVVRIRGPQSAAGELLIRGWCVPAQVEEAPVLLTVSVNGKTLGTTAIDADHRVFTLSYKLPADLAGKPEIEVVLEADRTISTETDRRQFGAAVESIEVRP